MEQHLAKKLIQKYFDAQTSVEEEKQLKNYFLNEKVASDLQKYRPFFGYITEAEQETSTRKVNFKTHQKYKWIKIAATLLLPISMYVGYYKYQENQAQKVYETSIQALQMLASNLHKGNSAITQLQEFENTKNKIFKTQK